MRFHVVYRNVNGKVQPVAMDKPEHAPRVKLPSKAKVIVVDKQTGKVVENVVVSEVDGNIIVTAEQNGIREAVVIKDGQARGVMLLEGAPASEMAASIPFEVLAVESGSSAALYIGGGLAAAAGGGAVFAATSDKQAPTFLYGPKDQTITENSPAGSQVYVAQAADNKGKVAYSLKAGSDAGLTIDPVTGKVTLSGTADYETKASYTFTVVATDPSGNASEQTVTVNVTNVDERGPTITSASTAATVVENSGAGRVVYTAAATDTDFVAPATATSVTYSLKPGSDAGLSIDPVTGQVTLASNPDYETKSSYSFTVIAKDAAGNATEKAVTFNIGNADEVAPTITSGSAATTIAENSAPGQVIYTATATDTDFVAPATATSVTYSLKPGSDAGLSIDPVTGQVTLVGSPDYETKSTYSFTVIARDAGGNAAEKAITLNIGNVDERGPTITSASVAATIAENSGAGQSVYTAAGTDTDFNAPATAGSITWSLKPAGDAAAFAINAQTGVVTLIDNPDYEAKSSYSFTVVGTDAAGNPTEKAVTLNVGDVIEDAVPPAVTAVALTSDTENTYSVLNAGDKVTVTVTMNEDTIVDTTGGTPRIALNIGGKPVYADYTGGSGGKQLTFEFTILDRQFDANGISIESNSIEANGGTLRDAAGNNAVLTHSAVADNPNYKVDNTPPVATLSIDPAIPPLESFIKFEATGNTAGEDNASRVLILNSAGDFVLTWTGTLPDQSYAIFVQQCQADGTPIGAAVQLDGYAGNKSDINAGVYALGTTGKYAVAWTGFDNYPSLSVFVQIFNADGSKSGDKLKFDSPRATSGLEDYFGDLSVLNANGDFVVTWKGNSKPFQPYASSAWVQKVQADGTLVGPAISLDGLSEPDYGIDFPTDIAAVGSDGSFIVTWYGHDSFGPDYSIFVQKFGADGLPSGPKQALESFAVDQSSIEQDARIVALGQDGSYAITWWAYSGNDLSNSAAYVQKFSADGTAQGATQILDSTSAANSYDRDPTITAVGGSGMYVVAWMGGSVAYTDGSIFVQLFNADGTKHGSAVKLDGVSDQQFKDGGPQVIALGGNGEYAVAWTGYNQGAASPQDSSVYVQKFNADGTLNGPVMHFDASDASGNNYDSLGEIVASGNVGDFLLTWNGTDGNGDPSIYVSKTVAVPGKPAGDPMGSSDEAGKLYLVLSTETVTSEADILALTTDRFNEQINAGANIATALDTAGLIDGDYKLYAVDLAGNISLASDGSVSVGAAAPASQLVFVLGEGYPNIVDGGDGVFNGWNGSVGGDDILQSATVGDRGYVDFAKNSVTVEFYGMPEDRPLDITGFGADDKIEIFLKDMPQAYYGQNNPGATTHLNQHDFNLTDWNGRTMSGGSYFSYTGIAALWLNREPYAHLGVLVSKDDTGRVRLKYDYHSSGPASATERTIATWTGSTTFMTVFSNTTVHWPEVGPPPTLG